MSPYEEEELAKNLALMWQKAAEKEEEICRIFEIGVTNKQDAALVRLLCILVVAELRYEAKDLTSGH